MSRDRFDDIYNRVVHSDKFKLNPDETMYAEFQTGGPLRLDRVQHEKVTPLCLKMAASFRRLATGATGAILSNITSNWLHTSPATGYPRPSPFFLSCCKIQKKSEGECTVS